MIEEKDRLGDDHPEWKKGPEEKASPVEMTFVTIGVSLFCLGLIIFLASWLLGIPEGLRLGIFMIPAGIAVLAGLILFVSDARRS